MPGSARADRALIGAGLVWRLGVGTLLGIALLRFVVMPWVGLGQLPDWALPLCMLVGWALPPPRRWLVAQRPDGSTPQWLLWSVLALLALLLSLVAWGSLVTPSRHWDGAVTWDLRAELLAARPTLDQPQLRDPAAYLHSRDYPLLQPIWIAALQRISGAGRLWFPLLLACLAALVGLGARRAGTPAWLPWVLVLACAGTPMLVNPTSGGADSGHAELLLAVCVAAMALGLARTLVLPLALGAMLAVAAKPEGLLFALLPLPVLLVHADRRLLHAATVGAAIGYAGWLQQSTLLQGRSDLLLPGAGVILAGAVAILLTGALLRRVGMRRRGWIVACGSVVAIAALVVLPDAWVARGSSFAQYLARRDELLANLRHMPAIAGGFLEYGLLRGAFGVTFLLPLVAWLGLRASRRSMPQSLRAAALFTALGCAALLAPFLLSPEPDLRHHLRSSMARLQLHWLGALWLLSAGLLHELLVVAPELRAKWHWRLRLSAQKWEQGAGPWLRTVRRAAFQLLPAPAQRWLLFPWVERRPRLLPPPPVVEREGLVSVVLPVHQQADLLDAAIRSVLTQSWRELELIVVDDGSGPEVAAVVARHAADPRLRWVRQPQQGLPGALNAGFELAHGEYWCWTSADNLMLPEQLTRLVTFLRARPDVALVYADYELIDAQARRVRGTDFRVAFRTGPDDARVRLPHDPRALAVVQDNFIGPCFCYRATVGRLLGEYAPEPGLEDYDQWLRMHRAFRLAHLGRDEVLYRYRLHAQSLTAHAAELQLGRRAERLVARARSARSWVASPDRAARAAAVVAAARERGLRAELVDGVTVLWCSAVEEVYRAAGLFEQDRGDAVLAFAAEPAVAVRLALFSSHVFRGPQQDAAAQALARAYAADRAFLGPERAAVERRRPAPLPQPVRPVRLRLLAGVPQDDATAARLASWQQAGITLEADPARRVDFELSFDGAGCDRRTAASPPRIVVWSGALPPRHVPEAALQIAWSVQAFAGADAAACLDPTCSVWLPDGGARSLAPLLQWMQQHGAPAAARRWVRRLARGPLPRVLPAPDPRAHAVDPT